VFGGLGVLSQLVQARAEPYRDRRPSTGGPFDSHARTAARAPGYFFGGGATGADCPATNGYCAKICATALLIAASRFFSISLVTTS